MNKELILLTRKYKNTQSVFLMKNMGRIDTMSDSQ